MGIKPRTNIMYKLELELDKTEINVLIKSLKSETIRYVSESCRKLAESKLDSNVVESFNTNVKVYEGLLEKVKDQIELLSEEKKEENAKNGSST